jgi:hypothetical protein
MKRNTCGDCKYYYFGWCKFEGMAVHPTEQACDWFVDWISTSRQEHPYNPEYSRGMRGDGL